MKKILLVSDLHLDDSIENEYRWGIFGQIEDKYYEEKLNAVYFLGDITDKKDRHAAPLINKLIHQIDNLESKFAEFVWIAGNHDYINQDLPFFAFHPQLFYGEPFSPKPNKIKELFLPHVKNPEEVYRNINISEYDIIFTHLDVKGTTLDNGMKSMEGLPVSFFKNVLTFSGHIHVGQKIGKNFHYIGSPYSIIYEREGILHRGIILTYTEDNKIEWEDTYFEFPKKLVKIVKSKDDIPDTNDGNRYKFDIQVKKSELDVYSEIKDAVSDKDIKLNLKVIEKDIKDSILSKVKSTDYFKEYCKANKLSDDIVSKGRELMNEN